MVYYTIYIRNLVNNTGYIDLCLSDEQLLRDYLQFLDIGVKSHNSYRIVNPGDPDDQTGRFSVNLADIAALTVMPPKSS